MANYDNAPKLSLCYLTESSKGGITYASLTILAQATMPGTFGHDEADGYAHNGDKGTPVSIEWPRN